MASLKNRELANAEDALALKIDQTHVKSCLRRGTARHSMGKHRLALLDFRRAATLNPKSRQIQTQLRPYSVSNQVLPKTTRIIDQSSGETSLSSHTSERCYLEGGKFWVTAAKGTTF